MSFLGRVYLNTPDTSADRHELLGLLAEFNHDRTCFACICVSVGAARFSGACQQDSQSQRGKTGSEKKSKFLDLC